MVLVVNNNLKKEKMNRYFLSPILVSLLFLGCGNVSNDSCMSDTTEYSYVDVAWDDFDPCKNSYDGSDEIPSAKYDEEVEMYKNNSLKTGDCPYVDYYGRNRDRNNYDCSSLTVKAPTGCDVIVIVKKKDSDGPVVAHVYIEQGDSFTFALPDGVYQPFFYMGNGWNPNKEMSGGVVGGFVQNESFSKDYPQNLEMCELSYELIQQVNGNFETKPSDPNELF